MRKILLITIISVLFFAVNAQTTYTVNTDGDTFDPSNFTINQGDRVVFNTSSDHPVLQVSQTTWNSNGSTPLSGGFSYFSGGTYTATSPGTVYYICENHIDNGMKGVIFVNATTNLENTHANDKIKIFPSHAIDYLNVVNSTNKPLNEIRIIDLSGRTILRLNDFVSSEKEVRIDVNQLSKGIYFININTGNLKVSRKFMKL